ncbi:MAG: DUF790 family protein [Labilithrix sp.]|nr:DUF790 family protein [Labilithrix sp.]
MLTADLVDARRKDGELVLRPLDRDGRVEALAVGAALLEAARACVGKRREELDEAWDAAADEAAPKRFKMVAGLRKLVADACDFEAETDLDPAELRRALFTRASAARRAHGDSERFDRAGVVADVASELALSPEIVERALFADLRSEHVLRAPPALDAASLVETWELGQAQAVLLTAVRITCEVSSASPGLVRAFFAKLKFHKLLFSAERIAGDDAHGWRVVIDGPYSMFDAVTKYGLRLAFAYPALRALERWSLVADIKWGKTREPLVFRLGSDAARAPAERRGADAAREDRDAAVGRRAGAADAAGGRASRGSAGEPKSRRKKAVSPEAPPADAHEALHLSDEVRELLDGINGGASGWRARPATVLLDVPGQGICIPDLELRRAGEREPIYVEVLGYWSRDAVFRRVELAERGLGARVVFAVSSRLRVSAEVLDDSIPSALYVYKGKMSPRAVADHATRLASGPR